MKKYAYSLFFVLILVSAACQVSIDMGNPAAEPTNPPAPTNTPHAPRRPITHSQPFRMDG